MQDCAAPQSMGIVHTPHSALCMKGVEQANCVVTD